MQNEYGTLVEQWKVDLIVARAKRQGFREHEIEDAQQEVIIDLLSFVYDPVKSNGAAEKTVLTALIDKKLKSMKRGAARRKKHEDKYSDLQGAVGGYVEPILCKNGDQKRASMASDLQYGIGALDARSRTICYALSEGKSRASIAKTMGLTRYQLDEVINGIRLKFEGMELEGWVDE